MPYPQYVIENLGGLAEQLLQRPGPDELDENGCFSKASCAKVEAMILADLSPKLKGFYMPAEPGKGTDPNNRWRTVSCLQKAIRFGDVEMAMFAASAAYDMDCKYLLRRLGICAIEDVGAGGLYGLLAILAVSGSQAWREAVDERRLFCFIARMLAESAKDRTACELLVIVDFNTAIDKEGLGKLSDAELATIVTTKQNPLTERMTAAWLMAGTKKFWGESMPKANDRPATGLFALMARQKMSRALLYAAAKVASRLNEGMFVSLLFMDEWLQMSPELTVAAREMPATPMPKVGKLLGAAYDMHTREGRTAIGKFKRENPKLLAPFLKHAKPRMEETVLWFGVFVSEGGLLRHRAVYANAEVLRELAHDVELSYPGLPVELHEPYVKMLQENLPLLNEARAKVLYATSMNK